MALDKDIKILQLNIDQAPKSMPPEVLHALKLGVEALKAIAKMRHYPFPDEILKLPGEDPE